jgi:DNA-directed RNA polymerase specialized sigma24 family protein
MPESRNDSAQPAAAGPRTKSELTQEAFDRFLACLDSDRDAAGAKYLDIRHNLVRFFEWRGCPFPEDHADEAMTRAARRIGEGEQVREAASYVVGVARLLLLEIYKAQAKRQYVLSHVDPPRVSADATDRLEQRANCLRRCLDKLSPEHRDLILTYYQGDKSVKIRNRKQLTERLQLGVSTLRMRALRIRQLLQGCVKACVETSRGEL